jgi:hypothetical protein
MLAHALECIPSEEYDEWVRIGLALKNSLGDAGLPLWIEWSRTTQVGNFDETACYEKWEQNFDGEVDNPITIRSVYHEAKLNGWSPSVFAESLIQGVLETIEKGDRGEVLADDFIEILDLCKQENLGSWEREISPALARKSFKSGVDNLLKARRKKRAKEKENDLEFDLNEPIVIQQEGGLPVIHLIPARTHEVLRSSVEVLAETKQFFRQGSAICKVQKTAAKTEIVTFSKAAELRPELLNHAIWLKPVDSGGWTHTEPDQQFAAELQALIDKSPLKEIGPIARQPFFSSGMSLCNTPGYDEVTTVYGDFDPAKFSIPERPSREDALSAAAELCALFEESGLETEFDQAAALSLILTAAVRPALPTAPFFLLNAKDPGAGKKYLGDIACQFISPEPPLPLVLKKDQNEVSKAIFSSLIKGQSSLIFDEVMTDADGILDLPKPLLTIATSEVYQDRVLGSSQMAECSTRVLGMIMGNNLRPTQDSVRRLIQINFSGHDIVDGVKVYSRDPLSEVQLERERYVGLAFTIIQAWVTAGKPKSSYPKLPTFGVWCQFVREPILWLGYPDPVHNTLAAQKQDDQILNLHDLFTAWYERHGSNRLTAGQLLQGTSVTPDGADDDPIGLTIKELVPPRKDEDITQALGYFLNRSVGRIIGGLVLRKVERNPKDKSKRGNRYFIEKIGSKDAANSDFYGEEVL